MINLSGRFDADLRNGTRVTVVAAWLEPKTTTREHGVRHTEQVPTFLSFDRKTHEAYVFPLWEILQIDPTTRPRL